MLRAASSPARVAVRGFSNPMIRRDSFVCSSFLAHHVSNTSSLPKDHIFVRSRAHIRESCRIVRLLQERIFLSLSVHPLPMWRLSTHEGCVIADQLLHARHVSTASFELQTDNDVVRFSINKPLHKNGPPTKVKKRIKKSKKAKVNELRFYRLKAKKKMNSPNPEVRIRYKLEKAKRKEEWLIEKLRKFEVPKAPAERYDPEILTEEEKHYLKRTGEKKKNYVPVGRRGVFGGVVLNMHLHWKKHETVKVICKPCRPGQVHEYADELARLSKGIVIDIRPDNTIIFYRGKNYVQPKVMSPPDTLSKDKALEKYKFEQSLEHTSQFIERLEKELEEYHDHIARFKKEKEGALVHSGAQT
ncbi:uncharacterized CRM domain-containing protein At3g25440, chloroplastic isoform X1 [Syzygium oleosum]|uniref:uncharacterized CRM domain-containing protein At3g25440, chloroplastic isoform X1 n=1 Tax=Syzygium oleosum TaxID=219896 RepID=UPI0024BA1B1C|nr:uncharacterized CRM domain-containing protein At3g25440, chloroplastic isoform X1 [Syzygium oleosum]XP_056163342.1 uncharacterized CRM domain-containing protein At3g25440, chloroplastic isoform X1 [Syzygium oleosum]